MQLNKNIIIAGAGASGLACALSTARNKNTQVFLFEKTGELGGTLVQSLIHTIGGLYNSQGDYLNTGLPLELTELLLQADHHTRKRKLGKLWVLNVDSSIYTKVVKDWIEQQSNITVLYHSHITAIESNEGLVSQIKWIDHQQIQHSLQSSAIVDATGNAALVRLLNPELVIAGTTLAGLIFQVHNVKAEDFTFPKNIAFLHSIKQASKEGKLPAVCAMTWFDSGVYENEIYVKLSIPVSFNDTHEQHAVIAKLFTFLKKFPAFEKAKLGKKGILGIRDGGRIKGTYCLTVEDVKSAQRFNDVICRCNWPIEYWDAEKGVLLDYLPEDKYYDIPLRSLQVQGMKNMWAIGKCLSAEKRAQASARVVGTCWAMGDGLGKVIRE